MRTLALDMGSRCGWAIGKAAEQGSGQVCSGVWDIAPRRGESPGMRYLHLRAQLQRVRAAYPDLAAVFYELGQALDLSWLRDQIEALPVDGHWHAQARGSLASRVREVVRENQARAV